jgi:hypothetical protein
MVLIPTPIFKDADDIIDGLQWRLPRKPGQMFTLTVNGERVKPPPLVGRVHFLSDNGKIEVHADVEPNPDSDTGMWFTDATTGFRVVQATQLGATYVPPPYCYNGLSGDIFVQGLLKRQNASRGGLSADYLRSDDWREVKASLYANRASVDALLPSQRSRENVGDKEMNDLITLAGTAFGPPQVVVDEFGTFDRPTSPSGNPNPTGAGRDQSDGRKTNSGTHTKRKESPPRRPHPLRAIRLGEHDFLIDEQRLDAHRFAKPGGLRQGDEPVTIYLNDMYGHMPARAEARSEHITNAFLFAAACSDPELSQRSQAAMDQVVFWRAKLFPGK